MGVRVCSNFYSGGGEFAVFEVILTIYLAFFFRTKFLLQPMLCVTAVNPFLLSKVPALLNKTLLNEQVPCVRYSVHSVLIIFTWRPGALADKTTPI